jgi:hypothetical protein
MSPVVAFPFIGLRLSSCALADDKKGSVKLLAAPPVRRLVNTHARPKGSSR